MNKTVTTYLEGLKNAYYRIQEQEEWDHFEKVVHGASQEDINRLKQAFPLVPDELVALLQTVDGTYWRDYNGEQVRFYLLGSDIYEYPYYLLSTAQILEGRDKPKEYLADYVNRKYDWIEIDDKITDNAENMDWLHFSDCMNNGGTSMLFIDFRPSKTGQVGQIIRYLHDPDELKVIAGSFQEYLTQLMDNNYDFITED